MPIPPEFKSVLAVLKSANSVQATPFHCSVTAVADAPPAIARADVLLAPTPLKLYLAVFKSATSVQLVPFQDSV